jgi:hypothetical protein
MQAAATLETKGRSNAFPLAPNLQLTPTVKGKADTGPGVRGEVAPMTTPETSMLTDLNADQGLTREMRAAVPKTEIANTSGSTSVKAIEGVGTRTPDLRI